MTSEAAPCPLQPCYFAKWDILADTSDCLYVMGFPLQPFSSDISYFMSSSHAWVRLSHISEFYFRNYSFQKIRILVHLYIFVSLSKLVCYYLIIMLLFMGILFLIIWILLHLNFPFLCLIVMTRCTYVSTNFGGLRPSYSYVGLRQKWMSRTFYVLQRGSWGFAWWLRLWRMLCRHPHISAHHIHEYQVDTMV